MGEIVCQLAATRGDGLTLSKVRLNFPFLQFD